MTKVSVDMIGFYFKIDVPKCSNSDENTPFADAADDEAVTIPKDKYELMMTICYDVRNHSVRRRYAHAGCEGNPRVRQVRPRLCRL